MGPCRSSHLVRWVIRQTEPFGRPLRRVRPFLHPSQRIGGAAVGATKLVDGTRLPVGAHLWERTEELTSLREFGRSH